MAPLTIWIQSLIQWELWLLINHWVSVVDAQWLVRSDSICQYWLLAEVGKASSWNESQDFKSPVKSAGWFIQTLYEYDNDVHYFKGKVPQSFQWFRLFALPCDIIRWLTHVMWIDVTHWHCHHCHCQRNNYTSSSQRQRCLGWELPTMTQRQLRGLKLWQCMFLSKWDWSEFEESVSQGLLK